MTPSFAAAVDPFIVYVIKLLERIEGGLEPDPAQEQQRLRAFLDQAEVRLSGASEVWQLAKYALAAWADEMLIAAPWEGRTWWTNHALEFALFRKNTAFSEFYTQAEQAANLPNKDALEVFYVCVIMGFRGLYQDANASEVAPEFGLPPTVEEWARRVAESIRLGQGVPPIHENPRPGDGAPPLEGKFYFLGAVVLGVTLLAVLGLLLFLWWDTLGRSG